MTFKLLVTKSPRRFRLLDDEVGNRVVITIEANKTEKAEHWKDLVMYAEDMVEALQFALSRLEEMTTSEFQNGGDREIRDKLTGILELTGVTHR